MLKQSVRSAVWRSVAAALLLAVPSLCRADVVSDWNDRAIAIGAEKQMPNAPLTRALAMMHVAMFEAVNAPERRYVPYKLDLTADKKTSKEAAASAAAHAILTQLFPDKTGPLDQALDAALAAVAP